MFSCRELSVIDPIAHQLLAEYFSFRSATFPMTDGYHARFPPPEQFEHPNGVFLVVDDRDTQGGADIGCGGVRSLGGSRFEIKHLWIRPAWQGRGLGRALLNELEKRAIALGATEFVLDTNASLETAGHLYKSSGYSEIEAFNDNPNATHWYLKRAGN